MTAADREPEAGPYVDEWVEGYQRWRARREQAPVVPSQTVGPVHARRLVCDRCGVDWHPVDGPLGAPQAFCVVLGCLGRPHAVPFRAPVPMPERVR